MGKLSKRKSIKYNSKNPMEVKHYQKLKKKYTKSQNFKKEKCKTWRKCWTNTNRTKK